MIVKKKSEEADRKRAYKKRVLELLYPDEHASSPASSVDRREGSIVAASEESRHVSTSNGEMCVSATKVTERVQLKRYGVSSPPADLEPSSREGNLQDQTAAGEDSSSEEPVDDDLSLTRRRRRRKRQRTSHDQPTTSSAELHPVSTASQSERAATETANSTESLSKNRKRKLKKKLKNADRKHAPSSEFVYKDIHETITETISSETSRDDYKL